ncbi:MAG: flagellar biosynthesis protein FlhB [Rubrivivax sp.]
MADSAQDKQLPASQRKIQKSREEGQVARSRDLGHFAACFIGGLAIVVTAPQVVQWLRGVLARQLKFDATTLANPHAMGDRLVDGTWQFVVGALPLGLLMLLAGVAASVGSGGWNFSWKALQPKFSKFDPISGVARLFSLSQLGQTLKACALAVLLGIVAWLYLQANFERFTHVLGLPLPAALGFAGSLVWGGIVLLLIALGFVAVLDVPLQRFMLMRQLRMSHQEAKNEHKDAEGNAEVKSKIKVRMREASNRRMLAAVPKANLVVMNPTHFAVALQYDETMAAPKVVAKGADLMAFRIRDAAHAANVPVLEQPPLARALYAHTEVDREIPAALFAAVAQVLAWVFQLRNSMGGRAPAPGPLRTVEVPEDLDPNAKRVPARAEGEAAARTDTA